ncbi:MAG: hypothetical protein LBQ22_10320 [Bacteroidales bacterium]|jgi:hypothetical protein|nr:hypothetical protein [Bacteroidales bacterium]
MRNTNFYALSTFSLIFGIIVQVGVQIYNRVSDIPVSDFFLGLFNGISGTALIIGIIGVGLTLGKRLKNVKTNK